MDTTGDLLNLLLGVEARVFGIRFEFFNVSINDRERGVHVLATSNVVARPCAHRCHGKLSADLNGCEGTHGPVALMRQCRTVAPGCASNSLRCKRATQNEFYLKLSL